VTSKHVAPRGTGPTIAAVERREASVSAETQGARWRLRAYVNGPPKGAAAPERLSALCPPHPGVMGKPCLGGYLPRENDHAYADIG
jgi:hypothetical protein